MLHKLLTVALAFALTAPAFGASDTVVAKPGLSATDIANRNVEARGGLAAWRAVHTISESGRLGAGGDLRSPVPSQALVPPGGAGRLQPLPASPRLAKEAQLPFVIDMERPRKERLEIQFEGKTAIQVYDGSNGWKVRPFLNRIQVEPFTAEELKLASMQSDLDGPLVDYAAKGTRIGLDGTENVDSRAAYKLKLTSRSGHITHLWIDAETFLETKIEGQPRKLDGKMHPVEIYYRDYRKVDGLEIPFLLETKVLPPAGGGSASQSFHVPTEKIIVDKVVINPSLDAALFTKPDVKPAVAQR